MTIDTFSCAIDLVIFTVANPADFPSMIWDESLVSYGPTGQDNKAGLSLFVVTVPDTNSVSPAGKRILPGGFLSANETMKQAASRIAAEKLGLKVPNLMPVRTFYSPFGSPSDRVLSFPFWAMVSFEDVRRSLGGRDQIGLELVTSRAFMDYFEQTNGPLEKFDGVSRFGYRTMPSPSEKRWHRKFLTEDMPTGQVLGLDHDDMVFYAWRQLRHAFDGVVDPFTFLRLNPLGEEFRLSELQEFREVCRGETIQRDYFKRQMLSLNQTYIQSIDKTDRSRPGKPAKLYKSVVEIPAEDTEDSD